MRKTLISVGLLCTISSAPAFAGGMAEPVMEPEVIVEESSTSSGGIIIPLLLLALVAAAASGSGGSSGSTF